MANLNSRNFAETQLVNFERRTFLLSVIHPVHCQFVYWFKTVELHTGNQRPLIAGTLMNTLECYTLIVSSCCGLTPSSWVRTVSGQIIAHSNASWRRGEAQRWYCLLDRKALWTIWTFKWNSCRHGFCCMSSNDVWPAGAAEGSGNDISSSTRKGTHKRHVVMATHSGESVRSLAGWRILFLKCDCWGQ